MITTQIACVILLSQDKENVLLQLRDDIPTISMPGYWSIPGGHIEETEEKTKTATREFYEETHYKLSSPTYLTSIEHDDTTGKHYLVHYFYDIYDGKQPIECLEGAKMEFVPINQLSLLKLVPNQAKIIHDLVKRLRA